MPATAAQIAANKANAAKSSGPRTPEGKARSRGNALKHGLTGGGIALPVEDAAEVDRIHRDLEAELKPSGQLGRTLVRRMALLSVRMDRCVAHETATLTENIFQAEAEFDAEWPAVEGEDNPDRDRARLDVAHMALFDPSKEATLARKYEASAERGFFRALKELRLAEEQAMASAQESGSGPIPMELGSFLPAATEAQIPAPRAASPSPPGVTRAAKPAAPAPKPLPMSQDMPFNRSFDVPFAIGRAC